MRIAIAKTRRGWGGGSTVALNLAQGLQARGHDVVMLCHPRARVRDEARACGIAVEPVLHGRAVPIMGELRSLLALRRHRSEVLIAFIAHPGDLRFCVWAAHRLKLPIIIRRGTPLPMRPTRRQARLFAMADRFLAVSRAVSESITTTFPGLQPPPALIYNGADVERFAAAPPAALGLPSGAVAIGYIGRLHSEKGIGELADAWQRVAAAVPAAHLVIVGTGAHEPQLRARLDGTPRVHWLGYLADTAGVHRALDMLVLPSHAEGFGNVLIEAMAAGRPVIASRVAGPLEVVRHGDTGLLVPPRDADALARAIISLATDAAARRRMGERAAALARERFSWRTTLDAYESLLRDVVASHAAGRATGRARA